MRPDSAAMVVIKLPKINKRVQSQVERHQESVWQPAEKSAVFNRQPTASV